WTSSEPALPDHRQAPRLAVGALEHAGLLLVAAHRLAGRVPAQRAAGAQGDVAQVADGRGAVADLDVADRPPAGADRLQPVLVVVAAHRQADVAVRELGAQDLRRLRGDAAAVHEEGALAPHEADAARRPIALADDDAHAV